MTDFIGMYLQAITFLDCACICNKIAHEERGNTRSIYLGTPVVVNCAFACEIFLKLLLEIENVTYKKQHGLKELFDLLSEELKGEINRQVFYEYGSLKDGWGFDLLQRYSDVFTQWRYSYEYNNLQVEQNYLFVFCKILKKECEERLGWKGYDGREK